MDDLITDFLKDKNIFAVVGVSKDPNKYGNRVYFKLKRLGYKTYAINPNLGNVNSDKVYPNVSSLPEKPDVLNMVVPPKIGINVVKEAKNIGISKIWLQPGSESDEIISFCRKNKISIIYNMCVMIEGANYKNR